MSSVPPLSPTDIVIFGGNGDLALRKILPGLYYRYRDGQLPENSRILGIGRAALDQYVEMVKKACEEHVASADFDAGVWNRFSRHIHYAAVDADDVKAYAQLAAFFAKDANQVRVFYLSTPPDVFGAICRNLHNAGLVTPDARVVLEKPIGHDLESFRAINNEVLKYFEERQVYRIDHYLGKETVQNLMILRFANNLFEKVWNSTAIDHVQITVAESLGVESRARYYDKYGALRDMVQNHLLQLLCLIAMEPPPRLEPDILRDEKLKVLRSLRLFTKADVVRDTIRGQYRAGASGGKPVGGYVEDLGQKSSDTETFVAVKAHVDNWRWSGVPFYLRTGKRLPERFSEIVVQFRPVPHQLFPDQATEPHTNKLIIRLQPDESIKLEVITKVPGPGGYRLKPVHLNLSLSEEFEERTPDAYERLLMDVVRGNPTLFMRSDEVEAAWVWAESILNGWEENNQKPKPYIAGSWGPADASALMARDGRRWQESE
ncbi:MAG TPA: glucose-6-phosphate dehydrogenase [Rickettsiales bacterium]|nr:glucose-6-phosphate dehydrogenase [Rickettsiales bacterium]